MRILILLAMITTLSGCTAMLVGGSAEGGKQDECSEDEKGARESGCE